MRCQQQANESSTNLQTNKRNSMPSGIWIDTTQEAELNYLVHEKELLAILRALKKWQVNLLEESFTIFIDYCTLTKFKKQKNLSRW